MKNKDDVEHFLKGIAEGGIGLTSARRQGRNHARKLEHLKDSILKVIPYLDDHVRDKESEIADR